MNRHDRQEKYRIRGASSPPPIV